MVKQDLWTLNRKACTATKVTERERSRWPWGQSCRVVNPLRERKGEQQRKRKGKESSASGESSRKGKSWPEACTESVSPWEEGGGMRHRQYRHLKNIMGYVERNGQKWLEKEKKKATVCDRIQACFSGNGNPLMHAQAEARHIHICILDEIFHGSMEDEFEGSLKYVPSHFSRAWLFVTLWTVACQGLSRQEYWSWLLCTSQGDLPYPGIEPLSLCLLHWQAGSSPLAPPGKSRRPGKRMNIHGRYQDLCWCSYSKGRKDGTNNQNSLAVESVALANCVGLGATVIQVPQRALVCWLLPNTTT